MLKTKIKLKESPLKWEDSKDICYNFYALTLFEISEHQKIT